MDLVKIYADEAPEQMWEDIAQVMQTMITGAEHPVERGAWENALGMLQTACKATLVCRELNVAKKEKREAREEAERLRSRN